MKTIRRSPLEIYLQILLICKEPRNNNDIVRMANIPHPRLKLILPILIQKEHLTEISIPEFNRSKFKYVITKKGLLFLETYIELVTIFNKQDIRFEVIPTMKGMP